MMKWAAQSLSNLMIGIKSMMSSYHYYIDLMVASKDGNEYPICVKAAINTFLTVPQHKMTIIILWRLIESIAVTQQLFLGYQFLSFKTNYPNCRP